MSKFEKWWRKPFDQLSIYKTDIEKVYRAGQEEIRGRAWEVEKALFANPPANIWTLRRLWEGQFPETLDPISFTSEEDE